MIDTARQVGRLFPDLDAGTVAELRAFQLPERKGAPCVHRSFHTNTGTLINTGLRVAEEAAMYVGVGARRCPGSPRDFAKCTCKPKGATHIAYLSAAWVELDVGKHGHGTLGDIIALVDGLRVPPNMIIASGGGAHCYWVFPQPLTDLARVKSINRALCKRLGADPAFDPTRVLRLAGTWHRKREPVRVQVLRTPTVDPALLEVECCA